MKHKILTITLALIAINVFSNSVTDFEFFKSIPKYESITLSGQDISIVIKSNYSVVLSGSNRPDSYTTSELTGSGIVTWDATENCLFLQLNGSIFGSYSRSEDVYVTKKKYNVGSTLINGIFGSGTTDYTRTVREFDHTEYYTASGSNHFNVKIPIRITDAGKYTIDQKTFSATLTGNTSKTVSFSLNNGEHSFIYGDSRTMGYTNIDEFGAWQWTEDRLKIYLCSTNMPSDTLAIEKDSIGSKIMLYLSFSDKIEGILSSYTKGEEKLVQIELGFDGNRVTLPFNENGSTYSFGTYNRFLEQWNWNAASLIEQIKDKQTIIVSYKRNGGAYSSIFELEGLETLLSYF